HARALINIEEVDVQLSIFRNIIKNDHSVRKTEELVRQYQEAKAEKPAEKTKPQLSYELKNIQEKLSSHFGTKVVLKADKGNKGEISIPYVSHEDLNRILEIINF